MQLEQGGGKGEEKVVVTLPCESSLICDRKEGETAPLSPRAVKRTGRSAPLQVRAARESIDDGLRIAIVPADVEMEKVSARRKQGAAHADTVESRQESHDLFWRRFSEA